MLSLIHIYFGSLGMLVESKTTLLRLDAKQQVPNLHSINNFYQNNIREAYDQLQNSYRQFLPSDIPIIKVILLYDEFSNTAIMEMSLTEVFEREMCIRDRICTLCRTKIVKYISHNLFAIIIPMIMLYTCIFKSGIVICCIGV